jgi:hypothetical protein
MNEKQRRVLEIGSDLMRWGLDFARLLGRIGEVEKMPNVPELDKKALREAALRLGALLAEVVNVNESHEGAEALDHLFASYDRLGEEMAALNQKLDRLLKP